MSTNAPVTAEEIAQAVADNAKSGKWLSCTFQLANPQAVGGAVPIGIKAFGKWVQRIECLGIRDSIPEQRTLKALKAHIVESISGITKSLGLPADKQGGE